ncbi:30S ribosomal protein S6 [Pseudomonadota bacterium]|nr:30S ribosomal protein S6 [Pseudomonadota bacterium]
MQNYEIALIINPDLSKDIDKFFTSFEKLLSDNNFSISRLEDVGRRKLAYSIDDHNKGHYLFYYVEGTPENVSEIENKIKFNDMIIRHLFVKINNIPDFESDLKEDSAKEEDKPKKATKSVEKKDDDKKSDVSKENADEVSEEEKVTENTKAESEKEETKDE